MHLFGVRFGRRLDRSFFRSRLKRGAEAWNAWRTKNPTVWPDLREFSGARINLRGANLENANLLGAKLPGAHLQDANFENANLKGADLAGAHLESANLRETNLYGSSLLGADLTRANLVNANLNRAYLDGARMDYAIMGGTSLGLTSLAAVHGWERLFHLPQQPSSIDLRTISDTIEHLRPWQYKLHYLRLMLPHMGVPAKLVDLYLEKQDMTRQWSTCFVSFSTKDQEFVDKLRENLVARGVECFVAPRDSVGGENILREIEANIALHDRVLVVCSAASMESSYVQHEVRFALEKCHATQEARVLLPVHIDDYVLREESSMFPVGVLKEQVMVDFTQWDSRERFEVSMERLLSSIQLTT